MVRLWMGPLGSGKTTRVAGELRRAGAGARLVVPTSTMAEHLRHELARSGAAVRPAAVTTLAGWIAELVPNVRAADGADLTLVTAQVLEAVRPAEYASLIGSPGLAQALAGAMEDLSNAGCDATQWAALGSLGVHRMKAFEGVYAGVEDRLRQHGVVTRSTQMGEAARRVREQGSYIVWFDGFFQFTRGELELIRALGERGQVTVTLPEWEGVAASREALLKMGAREERMTARRAAPQAELVAASSREREVDEMALRILEERERGRAWREMGVVVRSAHPYAALIQTTFARLGIPARPYFAPPLAGHAVGRFLSGLVEALLDQWEGQKTIAALRSAVSVRPLTGNDEYELRERLPFAGLEALGGREPHGLRELGLWLKQSARPREWARRLSGLARFVAPPPMEPLDEEAAQVYRLRAAALASFAGAMDQTAEWMDDADAELAAFWRAAREAIKLATVRAEDRRRDVVHVMDVYESRQWELPVVFVCGLVEGEFPRQVRGDAVLNDDTRLRLRRAGVPVRTGADQEQEEAFLFELARTRATQRLTLSWPEGDGEGRPALRAFALDAVPGTAARARRLAVRASKPGRDRTRPALAGDDVLDHVRARHKRQRPTAIEVFLQCPYQFFARYTLELEPEPALPQERLDRLALGTLVHHIIADWHRGVAPMDELMERHWGAKLSELRAPRTHRVAVERLLMERSLRAYEADSRLRDGWRVEVEVPLELAKTGVTISGRADRVDKSPDGDVVVCDFKYSSESGARSKQAKQDEGLLVQGGLYLAALEAQGLKPAGFYFVGVRGSTSWHGSDDAQETRGQIDRAVAAAGDVAARVAAGEIRVAPADRAACSYCEFADACRVAEESGYVEEAGA